MTKDPYASFASVYDSWQALYPKPFSLAMAPRIRESVRDLAPPGSVLADAACGTGILALWWQRTHRSWTVYGTDRSEAMILAARESTRRRKKRGASQPEFLVQDLTQLRLPQPASVVTCLFDSLNHVTRTADMQRIFRRVRESLQPGGLFLFDLVDELAFPEVFSGSSILNGSNLYVGMESTYREERGVGIGHALFTFFRKAGNERARSKTAPAAGRRAAGGGSRRGRAGSVDALHAARHSPMGTWGRMEFRVRERRWFRGEIREMLSGTGLDLLKIQRIDPLEHRDFFVPRTYWICRRPGRRP